MQLLLFFIILFFSFLNAYSSSIILLLVTNNYSIDTLYKVYFFFTFFLLCLFVLFVLRYRAFLFLGIILSASHFHIFLVIAFLIGILFPYIYT